MELSGVDAHDWTFVYVSIAGNLFVDSQTVFLVHFLDLPNVHSMTNNVMVEFVAAGNSCQFGSRKLMERMEI